MKLRWISAARIVLPALVALLGALSWTGPAAMAEAAPRVFVLDLDAAIGPVSEGYVVAGLKKAAAEGGAAVVLRIDTPGGLDGSMRKIIQAILASPVPVIGYVAPGGARAASAGTYILYACQIAAMAPGTNLGAATPVSLFGGTKLPGAPKPGQGGTETPGAGGAGQSGPQPAEAPDAEMTKVTNDAVAYIRSLAQMHSRNSDWAETAVREAASLPAEQALKMNVIDLMAGTLPDLLAKVNGRTVNLASGPEKLQLAGASVVHIAPNLRTRLLLAVTDPNVAFLLLLMGLYGLIFEFSHPGMMAPGIAGAISLLVGLYALSVIPVDLAGLALTLFGIGLMVAEAFFPTFGALGIGGAVAFVLGATMAFDTPGFRIAWPIAVGAAAFSAGLFLVVLAMLVRARRRPPDSGDATLIGAEARVIAWQGDAGEVEALGERWRARGGAPAVGETVRVLGREGLTLRIGPKE